MKSQILTLRVAGTIFGLVFLAHLIRLLAHASLVINGHRVPFWVSIVGLLVTGALCVWLWAESCAKMDHEGPPHTA